MRVSPTAARFAGFAAGLLLATCLRASASDIELTAESVSVNDDSTVTSYIGDVVLRVPADTPMQVKAKATHEQQGAKVLEGDVEIVVDDLLIKTQKATLTRQGDTVVKMDEAQASVQKTGAQK